MFTFLTLTRWNTRRFAAIAWADSATGECRFSPPGRSAEAELGQCGLVQEAVRGEAVAPGRGVLAAQRRQLPAGLLDDQLRRREIPVVGDRLDAQVDRALGEQHVLPEVAEAARRPRALDQPPEARTLPAGRGEREHAVLDVRDS